MGLGKLLSSLFGWTQERSGTSTPKPPPRHREQAAQRPITPESTSSRAGKRPAARPAAPPAAENQAPTTRPKPPVAHPTPAEPTVSQSASPLQPKPTQARPPRRRRDLPTLYGSREQKPQTPKLAPLPEWLTIEGSSLSLAETRSLANEIMRRRPKELLSGDMELDHFDFHDGRVEVRWIHYDTRGITAAATYRGNA